MEPERRSTKHQGVRTLAVVLANVACMILLWRAFANRSSAQAASANATSEAPIVADSPMTEAEREPAKSEPATADAQRGVASSQRDATSSPRASRGADRDLQQSLRRTAKKWTERAAHEPGVKFDAADVTVSVHVRELGLAGDVVAITADRPMRPASNMKLVTTAAALALLGPDWSFDTRFTSEAAITSGRLAGDLVVHAAGDPLYDPDSDGEVAERFEPALHALESLGLHAIDGALVLDESDFQEPARAPGWPSERQAWEEFCALAGGFSANAGCLTAVVRAGDGGSRASVAVHPRANGLVSKLNVKTSAPKSKLDIRVGARQGVVTVEGQIPRDVPEWRARFAAPDPVELFGDALLDALTRRGISVPGGVKRERTVASPKERELARISTPLETTLVPINTHSNNACADQLFLAMGHAIEGAGTREAASRATARALETLGISSSGLVQIDGSGLSRDNRITSRQITSLIDAVLRVPGRTSQCFADSLAVGGSTGTLDGRMQEPALRERVHAKTGFIAGTSALSGFIDGANGHTFVFSILVDYPAVEGLNRTCWKPMQDEMCAALVGSDG